MAELLAFKQDAKNLTIVSVTRKVDGSGLIVLKGDNLHPELRLTAGDVQSILAGLASAVPAPPIVALEVEASGNSLKVTSYPTWATGFRVACDQEATGDAAVDYYAASIAEAEAGLVSKWANLPYVSVQPQGVESAPWSARIKAPLPEAAKLEPPKEAPKEPPKTETPKASTKRFGTAVTSEQLQYATFADFIVANFQSVTARWEMKWKPMQGSATGAQAIAAFCVEHGISCRLHNGLWPAELPSNLPTSKAAMESTIRERLKTWLALGKGIVDCCADVTNEFFTNEGAVVSSPFLTAFGGDIMGLLEFVYKTAREVCAEQDLSIRLVMNEYGGVEWSDPKKTAKILEVAGALASLKLLDDLGDQYHPPNLGGQPSQAGVESFVAAVVAKTLGCQFTEIALPGASEGQWANLFKGALDAYRMTIWGPRDEDWDEGDATHAMPYNDDYSPKVPIVVLIDGWQGVKPPATPPVVVTPPPVVTPPAKHSAIIAVNDFAGWGTATTGPLLAAGIKGDRDWWPEFKGVQAAIADGADPAECCVIVSGTAEAEAALAAGVKLIEFQNEPYEPEQGPKTAEGYAAEFVSFANAMAGKGGTLIFAGYGAPWMEKAINAQPSLKQLIGGISMHPYGEIGRNVFETSGLNGEGAMEAMYAECVKLGVENPEIYITEWGEKLGGNPTQQANATRTFMAHVLALPYVVYFAYYQTHDDGLAEWGLFDGSNKARPVLSVVAEYAKARD